ncbi:MAG: hypothetical protein V2B18_08265, partial [Pseudomonadota bacterium]
MHLLITRLLLMVFVGLAGVIATDSVHATEIGRITDVTPSIDCKRLIIKFEGDIGPFATKKSDSPSQLSIEFEAAGLQVPKDIAKLQGKPIQEIKGLKHREGSRILIDFGRMAVPEFRVAKFDNHLVVFFSEFVPAALSQPRSPAIKGRAQAAGARTAPKTSGRIATAEKPSDLMVKSAEFFNGVLKVELAAKKNPEKAWRVDVGIDVGQPGFTSS